MWRELKNEDIDAAQSNYMAQPSVVTLNHVLELRRANTFAIHSTLSLYLHKSTTDLQLLLSDLLTVIDRALLLCTDTIAERRVGERKFPLRNADDGVGRMIYERERGREALRWFISHCSSTVVKPGVKSKYFIP